jgi:hypothetical protein
VPGAQVTVTRVGTGDATTTTTGKEGIYVGREVLVGLCVERSPDMLVGILGILNDGGAYVPLGPELPRERMDVILRDAGVRIVVTQPPVLDRATFDAARVVCIDGGEPVRLNGEAGAHRSRQPTGDNLAYVTYRSGSTGRPKGVMVQRTADRDRGRRGVPVRARGEAHIHVRLDCHESAQIGITAERLAGVYSHALEAIAGILRAFSSRQALGLRDSRSRDCPARESSACM